MRIVRHVFVLALLGGAAVLGTAGARAEVSQDVQQACTPDAMRLCSAFIPDVAKITACMKAKHSQLSAACITAMRGGGRHEGRREAKYLARRHEVRHEHHEVRHERHEVRHERHYRAHGHCDAFTHMCN